MAPIPDSLTKPYERDTYARLGTIYEVQGDAAMQEGATGAEYTQQFVCALRAVLEQIESQG